VRKKEMNINQIRILVLSNEVWNDKINGNNMTSNWFEGMDAEFANIYASPDVPFNKCCQWYYQISDRMMLNSILKGRLAGHPLPVREYQTDELVSVAKQEPKKLYHFLKSIFGPFLRFAREMLWILGKYDLDGMKRFIDAFQPDIIFSERMASCKMLRLEKYVSQLTDAPMIAFTGDDEYSLKQFSLSPFFWLNRFMVRQRLRSNVKKYRIYYTLSEEQAEYYERIFGCKCELLHKCGSFSDDYEHNVVSKPIRMIYAGKFYCNRWKMLGDIADVIRDINKDEVKIILEIYTKDKPTKKQNKLLNDGRSSFICGAVNQTELAEKYRQADIALHVESVDLKYRLATRFSFSTKIIDCIFSGCAVMAYCWEHHSGLTYLKNRNAAICVSSKVQLKEALRNVCENTTIIKEFSKKARNCGMTYHDRKKVQRMLLDDMNRCLNEKNVKRNETKK